MKVSRNFLKVHKQFVFPELWYAIERCMALSPGKRVLLLSGGHYEYAVALIKSGFQLSILTPSEEAKLFLEKRLLKRRLSAEIFVGNPKNLPFSDSSFDGVIALSCLEYYSLHSSIVQEVKRVLAVEGKVLFCNLKPISFWAMKTFSSQLSPYYSMDKYSTFSEPYFRSLLKGLKLHIDEESDCFHFLPFPVFGTAVPFVSGAKLYFVERKPD